MPTPKQRAIQSFNDAVEHDKHHPLFLHESDVDTQSLAHALALTMHFTILTFTAQGMLEPWILTVAKTPTTQYAPTATLKSRTRTGQRLYREAQDSQTPEAHLGLTLASYLNRSDKDLEQIVTQMADALSQHLSSPESKLARAQACWQALLPAIGHKAINAQDTPEIAPTGPYSQPARALRQYVARAAFEHGAKKRAIAKALHVTRPTLDKWLKTPPIQTEA